MAERSVPKPSVLAPRMMSPIIVAIINSFSSLSCSLQTMWAKMQRKFLPMFAELPRLLIMLLIFYFIVINFTKKKERKKQMATELFNLAWPAVRCQGSLAIGQ